jgi:hypothetical protein
LALTLHEAIIEVLVDEPHGLTIAMITQCIADRNLYRRKTDGQHPPRNQVGARVRNKKYSGLFDIDRSREPQIIALSRPLAR